MTANVFVISNPSNGTYYFNNAWVRGRGQATKFLSEIGAQNFVKVWRFKNVVIQPYTELILTPEKG